MNHELKCWPHAFAAVRAGTKTFEVRSNRDRDFAEGDTLILECYDPAARSGRGSSLDRNGHPAWTFGSGAEYGPDTQRVRVTYVLHGGRFGLPEGVCVMAIVPEPAK